MLRCKHCKVEKPEAEFHLHKHTCSGRFGHCKSCHTYIVWKRNLKVNFGITEEQYDAMNVAQQGVCEICHRPDPQGKRLSIDHDHISGQIRSLLCNRCNAGLGDFEDDAQRLRNAATYVERHQRKSL